MNRSKAFRNFSNSRNPQRSGSIIVLTAVSLIVLLIFAALLVDVAWMSSIQTEAQLASDISVRGALSSYVNDRSTDSYDVRVARAQAVGETLFENTVVGRGTIDVDPTSFVFGVRDEAGTFSPSSTDFANSVRLDLPNIRPDGFGLFLGPLIGVDTFNTSPSSTSTYDPIDLVLCLDISRSMAKEVGSNNAPNGDTDLPPAPGSRWRALEDSVNVFLQSAESQAPSLRIALISFGGGRFNRVVTPWDEERTRLMNGFDFIGANRSNIEDSLAFISSNTLAADTPMRQALELSRTVFQQNSLETTGKVCILLSDGRATHSTGDPLPAATALAQDEVTIHTIYFAGSDTAGLTQLQAIANEGGGLALNADNEQQLDDAFKQILSLLSVSIVE